MNRSIVIGIKSGKQSCIGCGLSENEAMSIASTATGFDSVEVYINAIPFSVFTPKKQILKPKPKAEPKSKKA